MHKSHFNEYSSAKPHINRSCEINSRIPADNIYKTNSYPLFNCLIYACLIVSVCADYAHSDIYRFVTIDGVESFTDAPLNKNAKIIVKEKSNHTAVPKKIRNNRATQKIHNIFIDEIVEKTVRSAINPPENAADSFTEPRLPPVGGVITSGVGMRIDPIDGKWRQHNGIDIAIPEGTPVRPAASGIVVFSGQRPGYGYTVLIEHDNGMITLYGHNSRLDVTQEQQVDADTVIAYSGNTGRSTGPHLHFEAWHSGSNVTAAFMPGNASQLPKIQLASNKKKNHFRKDILADGSILFTNIPDSSH